MAKNRKDDDPNVIRIPVEEDEEEGYEEEPTETEAIQPAMAAQKPQLTKEQIKWRKIHEERKQQLAFLKVWAADINVPVHELADRMKLKAGVATGWLHVILSVAQANGGDTEATHITLKQMYNNFLLPEEMGLAINDVEISNLIKLMGKYGGEIQRAAQIAPQQQQQQRQARQVPQQQMQQPQPQQQYDESHNYHNNLNNDNTMTMSPQQDDQFNFPEVPLLENILRNQGVLGPRIPGILSNYKYLRNNYLQNPQRFFEMLRSQLGPVNATGVFQNFQDAMGMHHPDVAAQAPGMAAAMPANGIFPSPTTGNQTMTTAGLMGNPQWANQPMNPNMWQYISQGMPPPPTGGSMADYFIWQKMYETWQEDQKFKRDQHRNINNIMGSAGQGGQQDIMSQIIPIIAATRQDLMVNWTFDPNTGRQIPSLVPNPSYQQNNGKDANTEITKAMMGMLSTIASGMIGQQNKPDQATQLLGSILPAVMNKAFNSTDQVQAIQKMIEISQTLQKPNVQMDPQIAQAQIDTKFAMWREELDYRKTVRDWDVQDRRERQAAQQQSQFLDMFKEAGKDAVPALLKMFSGPLMSMLLPKNATPEQMMAAAAQRMPGGMMPPGMVMPPPGMMQGGPGQGPMMVEPPPQYQQRPRQVINPFQGGMGMDMQGPPQPEINPFQGQPPVQQPQMYSQPPYNQAPPPQEEIEERPPTPEEFMQMHPHQIDQIFSSIHRKQQYLEQFENNARIGKARMKMMSQPPQMPQYNQPNMPQGAGGGPPAYGEGFVSGRGPTQPSDEDYVDENAFAYEMMPANTMTEAEESSKGGQVMSTNDLRNDIADYASQQIPDAAQGQGGYEPQGYDAINTQGMEQYEQPSRPQPGQAQSAGGGDLGNESEEPAPTSSIPEISEPLEPIEGTQMATNQLSSAQQPTGQQGERVIRRPSRHN